MKVFVHVEKNPESNAALQALYSRSPKSVVEQAEKLGRNNFSGSFMERVFIGYGHESVGDLGYTTLYFEGVSFLAEKAIQDFTLYVGQACSSRYIDFSKQAFINPYDVSKITDMEEPPQKGKIDEIHALLREFYTDSQDPLFEHLAKQFPNPTPEDSDGTAVWSKTIKARVFDVLRGFLPAGATTNVSWTVNLRNANQRLILLSHHPLEEVRIMARKAYIALYEEYPNSFRKEYYEVFLQQQQATTGGEHIVAASEHVRLEGRELFASMTEYEHFYDGPPSIAPCNLYWNDASEGYFSVEGLEDLWVGDSEGQRIKRAPLAKHKKLWRERVDIDFDIDFGSYRDLQRHRNGYCSMPVLETDYGVEEWYYLMLPGELQAKANQLMQKVTALYNETLYEGTGVTQDDIWKMDQSSPVYKTLQNRKHALQYVLPMATIVSVGLEYSVAESVYVAELRSGKTVHPTLRVVAQKLAHCLEDAKIQVYADYEPDGWSLKRGTQDIRTTEDDEDDEDEKGYVETDEARLVEAQEKRHLGIVIDLNMPSNS
jgi:thymidylate synthase ThyX